jgi:hypothetical protein
MSVGGIGSTPSFYQQDQDYWNKAQAQSQASSADAALINVMGQAESNLAKGLASIANQTALNRVNNKISALVEQLLNPSGSSTSSSSSNATASSASSSSTPGSPATGIGTARLTTNTSLSSLGILPGGTITVSAGNNATTYTSTGTDTVGDLINAINIDLPTNAQVTASLNAGGQLVITSRNDTDSIAIVGSGTDATAIGFGAGNAGFQPTAPSSGSSAASGSSTPSTASTTSAASGKSSSTSSSKSLPSLVALTEQSLSTAAGILSGDGVGGTLVDMLA